MSLLDTIKSWFAKPGATHEHDDHDHAPDQGPAHDEAPASFEPAGTTAPPPREDDSSAT